MATLTESDFYSLAVTREFSLNPYFAKANDAELLTTLNECAIFARRAAAITADLFPTNAPVTDPVPAP